MAQTKITALLLLTQMQVTDELQLFLYFILFYLKKNFNEYRTIVHDYTISDHHGTYSCVPAFLIPPFIHVCRGTFKVEILKIDLPRILLTELSPWLPDSSWEVARLWASSWVIITEPKDGSAFLLKWLTNPAGIWTAHNAVFGAPLSCAQSVSGSVADCCLVCTLTTLCSVCESNANQKREPKRSKRVQ